MKRLQIHQLTKWWQETERSPLILRGARQVGKSTLVRLFCQQLGLDLIEVNLELMNLKSLRSDSIQLNEVLDEIQLLTRKILTPQSLLFLDEIQEEPKLLSFLRYFKEQRPEIGVIAAGSLLEFVLQEGEYSFPVGRVQFFHLGPMTFEEFLIAQNETLLLEKIEKFQWAASVHERALEQFKKFLFVGGMPQVVQRYITDQSLVRVREVQSQIFHAYSADFPKYNKRIDVKRIARVFERVWLETGNKMIYQRMDSESKSRDIRRIVELLLDARVVQACYHSEGSGVPLKATEDPSCYKPYALDVGLYNALYRVEWGQLQDQQTLLTQGKMAEQFVAQHLAYFGSAQSWGAQPELQYWLREKGAAKGEVDFLFQMGTQILPVEVKSSSGGRMKSLFYFCHEKKINKAIRLSLDPMSRVVHSHKIPQHNSVEIDVLNLPIYCAGIRAAWERALREIGSVRKSI